ncbi:MULTISPECIES: acetate/propionate family kinase [unclassified Meridianimarinicoccus]|uniref:acetate/propionate family kinase n=1 Tax=unclassified Meridianimarinicoccus TaxID=2923344 RepID=UPI001867C38C|nr:acetate/propionate family kinase [Fluviibacterium sp. MJW13]
MSRILTLNSGSSSIKFAVYAVGDPPVELAEGKVDRLGSDAASLTLAWQGTRTTTPIGQDDHQGVLRAILEALRPVLSGAEVAGVGHRIVHGGPRFDAPALLDDDTMAYLEGFAPFAPLHQPYNLTAVRGARLAFPGAVQLGCFDTALHRGQPWVNETFALPRRFYDEGVRRYGFHGISYTYVAGELARLDPVAARGRTVVAHLGNGASMCALRDGKSVDSTMGFSALEGLAMGTRCGQLDPGVVLYLLQQRGMTPEAVTDLLYKQSGLKGLSGVSNDMRELEAADTEASRAAIAYFVSRIRRELGALAAVLGGLDTLVFTAGIGENSALVRAQACAGMDWLGITLDAAANAQSAPVISTGPVTVRVIPTDEELVIARAVNARIDG